MTYDVAVEKLLALGHELHQTPSAKFDLAHMRVLLEALGHPERRFPAVLIAGTNGKGSTAATLASILSAAGHRTGLYTSPHLIRINERIQVLEPGERGASAGSREQSARARQPAGFAGVAEPSKEDEISEPEFAEMHQRVDEVSQRLVHEKKLPWHPSFFETLTAMAFEYFASAGVEIAVLEVGMGGRLDATNVVEPVLSVITDVALDHQKFLGNTIAEIAREKAGIIRAHGVLITLPQHPEANEVIGRVAQERHARALSAVPYMPDQVPGAEERWAGRYPVQALGKTIEVASPLRGRHQLRNVALAIAAAVELNRLGLRVAASDIERGIRATRWPGRLQLVPKDGQEYLLDVAHNPAGAWALRSALSSGFEQRPLVFVFAALRDKAITEMAEILFPMGEHVVATTVANPRAASPEDVARAAARTGAPVVCRSTAVEALHAAKELAQGKSLVVVTGSIYLVGEALQQLAQ